MGEYIIEKEGNCLLKCHIQPSASKTRIAGTRDNTLKVYVTSPPVDGKANRALREVVAKRAGIPKSRVSIIKGERSRSKTILIEGVKAKELKKILLNE